jgi:NAD(P)-dependent dehydrogenase (short-subunit alcohol dehydrogenase family)
MPTVLVTGANRGIGLELVRQYAADNWRVLAGCRRPEKADELKDIEGEVEIHPIDVGRPDHIQDWAQRLAGQPIDVLINNAGHGGDEDHADPEIWARVNQVNVIGPFQMAQQFFNNLLAGERKLIVNLSSRMGSIGLNSSGGSYTYRASKAALNAAMHSLAIDVKEKGVTVLLLHPGWVKTDMGGPDAEIDVTTSVKGLRKKIGAASIDDSGRFFNYDGKEISW